MNKRQRKKNQKQPNNYNFSIGEKTKQEYERQARNTKAKINRVKKKHHIDLSEVMPIPALETFKSRKEFNAWVQEAESFRNRANQNFQFVQNEYGVSASKKRLRDIDEKVKRAQKLADEQIKKFEELPFYSGGKEQGTVGLQRPNKTGIYKPKDFDFSEVRSSQRLDEIEQGMNKKTDPKYYDERAERMKQNFVVALEGSFNSLADELVEMIKLVPAEDFYQLYLEFDEFDFDYFDTEGQTVEADEKSLGQMKKDIQRYIEGNVNKDLWHENFNRS